MNEIILRVHLDSTLIDEYWDFEYPEDAFQLAKYLVRNRNMELAKQKNYKVSIDIVTKEENPNKSTTEGDSVRVPQSTEDSITQN